MIKDNYTDDKKYRKVRNFCHCAAENRGTAHSLCNLIYSIPKEIHVLFLNGLNYDYHPIIKELVKEFAGEYNCPGENTEK